MKATKTLLAASAALLLAGCSEKKWTVEGTIAGAEGKALVLEAPATNGWYAVDTVTLGKNGEYSFSMAPAGHPEVFRLTLDGSSAYFPVDSLETVGLSAQAPDIASTALLSGSAAAEHMQSVNTMIAEVVAKGGDAAAGYDPELKRKLAQEVLRDPSGIVAYYTVFRRVGDVQVFDPSDRSDLRIIGAVANAYDRSRPDDPRTALLRQLYLVNQRATRGDLALPTDTIQAREISLPEIALTDLKGNRRSLNEEASKGKVLVLNFTAYTAPESPAFNLELAKVYDQYRERGLEIYQVALDADEFQWRESAANLPWITVYNTPADGNTALQN
ncbi:MAG: redoxin domain-containing protein, partial [Muribaculaceae bacterium]|nr:redoxin domain-containing protein [Muribaculaceae bacterium]